MENQLTGKEVYNTVKEEFDLINEEIKQNPEEMEKMLVEEAERQAQIKDPVESAATMYGLYAPKFLQGIKRLSSRQRSRLLKALIEYPLNEKKYNHTSQLEKEMMAIGHAVLEAKFLMILATFYNNIDQLTDAANPNIEVDLTDEEKEELSRFFSKESLQNKDLKEG